MAVQLLRTERGVDIAAIWIDNQIAFASGQHVAVGRKGGHNLGECLARICGFGHEDNVAAGCLPVAHVNRLRAVGRDPLPIIDRHARCGRVHFPFLPRINSSGPAIH